MKLKRSTALVLAGALALSTVPMNVFAYTGPTMVGETGDAEALPIEISDIKASVVGVTKTPGRTLLSVDAPDTSKVDADMYEYEGKAPVVKLGFYTSKKTDLTGDLVYEVNLSNAEFFKPMNLDGSTTSEAALTSDTALRLESMAGENTYVAQGFENGMDNVFELEQGVYFEYLSSTKGRFIVDFTEYMVDRVGANEISVPLIARTTSSSREAMVSVVASSAGTILKNAPIVAFANLDEAAIEADYVARGRDTINNASFTLMEPTVGFFDANMSNVISVKLKNGEFTSVDDVVLKGFGLQEGDYTVAFPAGSDDNDEIIITINTAAFMQSKNLPGELEVEFDVTDGNEGEVVAVVRWEDMIKSSLNAVVGEFTDYGYNFELADDMEDKSFEYPVLNSNLNYDETEEEDYEVLTFKLSDHVKNSILWDQRDFKIVISENAEIKEFNVSHDALNEDGFGAGDVTNLFKLDETNEEDDTLVYNSNKNDAENIIDITNVNELTFEVLVAARNVNSDDITVQVMGDGVSEDSDELKIGEFKQTIEVDFEVMSVPTNLGPQKVSSIMISELESGIFNDSDVFQIRLDAPDYLDAFAGLGNFGFYNAPKVTMMGDGEFEVGSAIVKAKHVADSDLTVEDSTMDFKTFEKDTDVDDLKDVENYDLEEGDLLVRVDVIDNTDGDETASILIENINVTFGILYSVPNDMITVEVTSFNDGDTALVDFEGDVKRNTKQTILGNGKEGDYIELNGTEDVATGVYYDEHYSDNYNTDIEMTIDKGTFTAVDADGNAISGMYASEDSSDSSIYAPKLIGNNSYVAIRSFANTIGGEVEWDPQLRTVYIYPQGKAEYINGRGAIATVKQDSPNIVTFFEPGKAVVDLFIVDQMGERVNMENINDVNFLPIRFFAEKIYKVNVTADDNFSTTKTFHITK